MLFLWVSNLQHSRTHQMGQCINLQKMIRATSFWRISKNHNWEQKHRKAWHPSFYCTDVQVSRLYSFEKFHIHLPSRQILHLVYKNQISANYAQKSSVCRDLNYSYQGETTKQNERVIQYDQNNSKRKNITKMVLKGRDETILTLQQRWSNKCHITITLRLIQKRNLLHKLLNLIKQLTPWHPSLRIIILVVILYQIEIQERVPQQAGICLLVFI